ncbi:lipid droplet-associated protein [Rhodococcus sp. IEGM 1401]|uniref:lipid droplet-associated protein n=1 Tax=unclassified Rhodococcus (in: high G+C Gram-positive bacteria) TaxID=192944 RepID=UPI0022B4279E|nr:MULTISPECIES: lipid droplet-associated protein [unclassified Rhodococcus (in: high G+C Gram-positive bacteria)]MCZ4561902.1 lipid droplet-associated protein [Rhodococcus sp. IEGM 1401]MDI9924092.1 lipid droplet-associated protein [Rhodococcus sp. IEGM 1372]MDV8034579.1 lipid droplet-associated protein [Rhodococcus sp. IEGM 1414]
MTRVPFAARVAAGVAVTVVEEARKLPGSALMLPMTVVSEALARGMRFQQQVTVLAIKGDLIIASLPVIGTPTEEQPSWASFDEDEDVFDAPVVTDDVDVPDAPVAEPVAANGRFALYSTPPLDEPVQDTSAKRAPSADKPEIVEMIDFDTLALAQLRARLRTLSIEDLETLLDYENDTLARAPFQTMLANRITTAKAK